MPFNDKIDENKRVAKKCKDLKAYNAGVTRAYYCAFLKAKSYLLDNNFDYADFLTRRGIKDSRFSHGTILSAATECLMKNGKKPADICKLGVWDNLYKKRIQADYDEQNIIECELDSSLTELDTILAIF